MNAHQLERFLYNIHEDNSFALGGNIEGKYCPVDCRFCICKANEYAKVRDKIPFVSEEEFEMGLKFVSSKNGKKVFFGDGNHVLSAEPFAHPEAYRFLERAATMFPEFTIMINTSGVLLDSRKIEFLNQFNNLDIVIHMGTLDPEKRQKLMRGKGSVEHFLTLRKNLRNLTGIKLYSLEDEDHIKRDIEKLDRAKPLDVDKLNITVSRLEFTRYHSSDIKEEAQKSISCFGPSLRYVYWNCPSAGAFIPTFEEAEEVPMPHSNNWYRDLIYVKDFAARRREKMALCTSEGSYSFWEKHLAHHPYIDVVKIRNRLYGGSINIAGLLTFQDVVEDLKEQKVFGYSKYLIPKRMLNFSLRDMHGKHIQDASRETGFHFFAMATSV